MAGTVKVDHLPLGENRVEVLLPRACPAGAPYGARCLVYDSHYGDVTWCPFMYRLVIERHGRQAADLRSPGDCRQWMSQVEPQPYHGFTVGCLRQESKDTPPGAPTPW